MSKNQNFLSLDSNRNSKNIPKNKLFLNKFIQTLSIIDRLTCIFFKIFINFFVWLKKRVKMLEKNIIGHFEMLTWKGLLRGGCCTTKVSRLDLLRLGTGKKVTLNHLFLFPIHQVQSWKIPDSKNVTKMSVRSFRFFLKVIGEWATETFPSNSQLHSNYSQLIFDPRWKKSWKKSFSEFRRLLQNKKLFFPDSRLKKLVFDGFWRHPFAWWHVTKNTSFRCSLTRKTCPRWFLTMNLRPDT